jgi:type 1 glutamine amidotransferase
MQRTLTIGLLGWIAGGTLAAAPDARVVTTATVLGEMADLARLARWPEPAYRTIQFSSYDRRSTTSEAPGWFSNADGFGGEPIPGFLKVLRAPGDGSPGLYLLARVSSPGVIVRGWTAGMGGVLRVYVDPDVATAGDGSLIYEGPAAEFLARRSKYYMKLAGINLDVKDALTQEDADYLPIPFGRGLKVTWEGSLNELHFYHLQVRLYPQGTAVRSFDPTTELRNCESQLRSAVTSLTQPSVTCPGEPSRLLSTIEAGRAWAWSRTAAGPGAVRELKLRLQSDQVEAALRGCLLRISFDGSERPQVESPLGDFFASGPGINPFASLPFSVEQDGTMTCRFVMPFAKSVQVEVVNLTRSLVRLDGSILISPWQWDERSLYFRAKWRADHHLLAGVRVIDLPYLVTIGRGVYAGCAAMVMNPSGVPTSHGNWWGEGDEKFLVDGEPTPSTFGTGSEDYFNYSWSRPDLFDHPYCGQPLDSGPDTSGYISNHRFQVPDAIPFERSLAAFVELRAHNPTPGLSYARIAYHYAGPGAIDDHRGLMPSDLEVPALPKRELKGIDGARGATFHLPESLRPETTAGRLETAEMPLATQHRITHWHAERGGRLKLSLPVERAGRVGIRLVALHRPDGAKVRVVLDGQPLPLAAGGSEILLRSAHAPRVLNVPLKPVELTAASHEIELECLEPGVVGLDYVWVKSEPSGQAASGGNLDPSADEPARRSITLPADSGMTRPRAVAVRGLVITGGHDHETSFYSLFHGYEDLPSMPVSSSSAAFSSDLRGKYDVLIMYDFSRDLDEAGKKNLRDFVESGKGIVVLHHALLDYQQWSWWYQDVVGGSYRLKSEGNVPSSTVKDKQQLLVTPELGHPITAGLAPFQIVDETYKRMWISPRVRPLLTTDNPNSDRVVAWVGPCTSSRVVAIQLGHGPSAHEHPSYRELVHRAILWAAGQIK